jgi:hypothetical protein
VAILEEIEVRIDAHRREASNAAMRVPKAEAQREVDRAARILRRARTDDMTSIESTTGLQCKTR